MKEFWKKNKLDIGIALYGIFYLVCFIWLELNTKTYTVVHSPIDDLIPFCEYFIVPYLLWFLFVFMTKVYFANEKRPKEEYYKLLATLCTGMTLFLIISFVFPNGHYLRPQLEEGGIFLWTVKILHFIDSPANILPSLHVFEAVACCTALLLNDEFRSKKGRLVGTVVLTVAIILSTLFLKQHSVVDVVTALILNCICYELFYRILPATREIWSRYVTKEELCTIPNLLSMIRIVLAILFLGIFNRYGMEEMQGVLMGILILSGITDFLDGKIARKFNMISEFGKIIDPIADKLTQAVVLWCLIGKYPLAKVLLLLFAVKESYMCIEGTKTVIETGKNDGASWYGKVSTAVFYTVMVILILFKNISTRTANCLLSFSGICMIMALLKYAREYKEKRAVWREERKENGHESFVYHE